MKSFWGALLESKQRQMACKIFFCGHGEKFLKRNETYSLIRTVIYQWRVFWGIFFLVIFKHPQQLIKSNFQNYKSSKFIINIIYYLNTISTFCRVELKKSTKLFQKKIFIKSSFTVYKAFLFPTKYAKHRLFFYNNCRLTK